MRIIARAVLREYWLKNPETEQPLKTWEAEVLAARWHQPADVKAKYRNASILKHGRVVFNIKGNDHRLVVAIAFQQQLVFIKFIGTHKEYDGIDAETIKLKSKE